MRNMEIAIHSGLTLLLTWITTETQAMFPVMVILLCCMVVDFISGCANNAEKEGLSSKAGVKGIVKKVGYLCVIIVAMFFDYIIMYALSIMGLNYEITMFFGLLVTVWFILNESLSILENIAGLGVPIPDFLTRYVKDVRGKINKKGEENLHD